MFILKSLLTCTINNFVIRRVSQISDMLFLLFQTIFNIITVYDNQFDGLARKSERLSNWPCFNI